MSAYIFDRHMVKSRECRGDGNRARFSSLHSGCIRKSVGVGLRFVTCGKVATGSRKGVSTAANVNKRCWQYWYWPATPLRMYYYGFCDYVYLVFLPV